jgi:beta-catenin-like protein 1
MSNIDDLFKGRGSSSAPKRKFDAFQDPQAVYKSSKPKTNGDEGGAPRATVDDAEDEEYGVAAPPEDDGAEGEDDEEGRFFGGGVNKESREALDYLEGQDEETYVPEKIDKAWVRRLGLNFEKRISKNAELRSKYEDQPEKFMASEADLDSDVKALSVLSEHPELYDEFVRLGCVNSLVSLLAHENTDIAIDAIEIISELTDEDVEAEQAHWDLLIHAMLDADLLSLLNSNFSRFDETNESDRSGVYHTLSVLENLSSNPTIASRIGSESATLSLLLTRLTSSQSPKITQNIQYTAELLPILLQSSPSNRTAFLALDANGSNPIDALLQLLAPYRRTDPEKGSEEEEYVSNLFDALTCLLSSPSAKTSFLEAEGIELLLIMLRDSKFCKSRALRLLDHAMGGNIEAAIPVCEKLVEAAGLKTVFGLFMKKSTSTTDVEHLLGIFASLLRCLPGESAARIRVLAKMVEKEWEKIERLLSLRREFASKVGRAEREIEVERKQLRAEEREEKVDEWLGRRLDAGLYCLQTVDVILAWLVAEDDGARRKVVEGLAERDEGLRDLKRTLKEQVDGMDEVDDEGTNVKEMLNTLITFL